MRNLKITIALFSLMLWVACGENVDTTERMSNYVMLTAKGETSFTEDVAEGIEVNAMMAYRMDKDVSVRLRIEGDDKNAVKTDKDTLVFKAGTKTASFRVLSNQKSLLAVQEVIRVVIDSCSDPKMTPFGNGVNITVKPNAEIPPLTDEQLKLIAGYKDQLGIDLTRMMGVSNCTVTIKFGNDDKEAWNEGKDTRTFIGKSIITLSDKATAETPVLKMVGNPMGMGSYIYEVFRKVTTEDKDFFMQMPVSAAVLQAVAYDYPKETFNVTLDGITLNRDGTLNFTSQMEDEYGDEVTKIPFDYKFSAWERMKKMAAEGKTVEVDEGGTTAEYALSDLLQQIGTLNPTYYLGNSNIATDAYGNEPSNYVTPMGKVDFKAGVMEFVFPWDFGAGGFLSDYINIHVVYTMHP